MPSTTRSFASSTDFCLYLAVSGAGLSSFIVIIFLVYVIKVTQYRSRNLESEKGLNRGSRPYEYAWERTVLLFLGCMCLQFFPWLQFCRADVFILAIFGTLGLVLVYMTCFIRIFRAFVYTVPSRDPRHDKRRVQWFMITENGFVHFFMVMTVLQISLMFSLSTQQSSENFILIYCPLFTLCIIFTAAVFLFAALVSSNFQIFHN